MRVSNRWFPVVRLLVRVGLLAEEHPPLPPPAPAVLPEVAAQARGHKASCAAFNEDGTVK